ncbi:MAG: type I DNA topoisomerase [bacterium]|nr:type I DNA topoisomerase [bacterium]
MKLVIVESPTKAKTIKRFLPKDFTVESSFGHIRDLPHSATEIPAKYKTEKWSRLGINIEEDFAPLYIIPKDKKKHVAKLKKLVSEADELYLATDEDREGEAISWHLLEVLKPTVPVHRMVFHEITKEAIEKSLQNARSLDENLVQAQETRRILDRLYGYEISPVLWRKVAPKLSAGRVQSAALQLIVNREKERMTFKNAAYWDIIGNFFTADKIEFEANLYSIDGKRIAVSKDFDGTTGELFDKAKDKVVIVDEEKAKALSEAYKDSDWDVSSIQEKPLSLSPKAPFITSTLQQIAGNKLKWPAKKVMYTAQKLYEQGFITYMRTDSVQLSEEALIAATAKIKDMYGAEYLPEAPRVYKNKSKNAQEAHEAIRPSGTEMPDPADLKKALDDDEWKLYQLIWQRTMASQMSNAKIKQTTVQLSNKDVIFQTSGRVIEFAGYMRVYKDDENEDEEKVLPALKEKDTVSAKEFTPQDHQTKPPARYTEASLVKELESKGIGRPSTYASIIDTIQRRLYVYKEGSALIPRFIAFGVVALLHNNFPKLVNTEYTAEMEEDLDEIAAGKREYLPYLKHFYFGDKDTKGLHDMLQIDIDARATCTLPIGKDKDGNAINVRVGRYGPFVEQVVAEGENTASIPDDLPPDQLTVEMALEFIKKQAEGPTELGKDPETDKSIYILEGRFGPYVQLGEKPEKDSKEKKPKMKGLLKGMEVADVTLEKAMQLLSYPKVIGKFEKTGDDIVADLGRFGPYIKSGKETRSVATGEEMFELTEEGANVLLNTPKKRGRGATAIRDIGKHPESGNVLEIFEGRYGPYIKYEKLNVSIPKAFKPEEITLEQAVELIVKKQEKDKK